MPLIIYNPVAPIGGSIGEQILTSEIQKMFESFQSCITYTKQHFLVVNSENELRELLKSQNNSSNKLKVICFCFPHEIPRGISCDVHVALPYFFEIATDLKDYSLPIERWKNILNGVQGILVTNQRMKNSLLKMEITSAPIHVLIPKLVDVQESDFLLKNQKIELSCDGYINTNDGPWTALETPPQQIIERFGGNRWSEELYSSNIGGLDNGNLWPVGFFPIENWGAWTETVIASLILPVSIWGQVQLSIDILAIGANIDQEITVRVGGESKKIVLKASLNTYQFKFEIQQPVNQVFFEGYVIDTDVDSRGLGIGVTHIEICRLSNWDGDNKLWAITGCSKNEISTSGFFSVESWGQHAWGIWAKSEDASLILPVSIWGRVQISIDILAIGANIDQEITVRIGGESKKIVLKASLNTYQFKFEVQQPVNQVFFEGYVIDTDVDSRGLGIGISQLRIKRNSLDSSKLIYKMRQIIKRKRSRSAEKTVEKLSIKNTGPSLLKLEIEGVIYLMELRALDLMFDNWIEIIKCYSVAFENLKNTNLVIICPSKLKKFVYPFANQFFNRIEPRSTLIHFVFLDDPSDLCRSLHSFENVIIIRRADGLEYESNLNSDHRNRVSIGPSANEMDNTEPNTTTYPVRLRRQIRQLLYGEFLPVVFTSDYDNDQLLKVFVESNQFGVISRKGMMIRKESSPNSRSNDFEEYLKFLTEKISNRYE